MKYPWIRDSANCSYNSFGKKENCKGYDGGDCKNEGFKNVYELLNKWILIFRIMKRKT